MKVQLENLVQELLPTVYSAAEYIRHQFLNRHAIQFQTKNNKEVVSIVDKTAEQMLVKKAKQLLPDAGFLTEEKTITNSEKKYRWIIDPVDGTTNFYYGIPFFATNIALLKNEEIVLGIVCDVMHNDVFTAWKKGGSYLNGKAIHCATTASTNETFLSTGIPNADFEHTKRYLSTLHDLIKHTRGIRRLGSAALELAYVASGRFDAFFESGLKPWDIAASICLIEEAGGIVSDLSGGENYLFGESILAAGKSIHPLLLSKLKTT